MRILAVPAAGGIGLGPLTNVLAIAEEARQRGHEVSFMAKPAWRPYLRGLGFHTYLAPTPNAYRGFRHLHHGKAPPPYKFSDIALSVGWTDPAYIRASVEAERRSINAWGAHAVITELQLTVPISTAIEGIPWVAHTSWPDGSGFTSPLYSPDDSVRGGEKNYNQMLTEYRLPPISDICELSFARATLKVAPTTPEMQPELSGVPDVHFVGHLLSNNFEHGKISASIERWLGDFPVIYVYLTTGDVEPSYWIPAISEAFKNFDVRVLVTLAPLDISPSSLPKVSNVRYLKRLPGTSVCARAHVVISHGGINSIANALLAGVPLIMCPDKYAERDYNARAVERLGAGVNISTDELTPDRIREVTRLLLDDPSFRIAAARIGERMNSLGGKRKAVDLIEDMIARSDR